VSHLARVSGLALAALALAGCEARLDLGPAGPASRPAGAPAPLPAVCGERAPLVDVPLRRLTSREYHAALADLLGEPTARRVAPMIADDSPAENGYDNQAALLGIGEDAAQRYADAAAVAAREVVLEASAERVGCEPTRAGCPEAFVRSWVRRAWRRPLGGEEISAFLDLATEVSGGLGWEAIGVIVEAALQSPSFLFRVEAGAPDPDDPTRIRLSGAELASRLTFLLTGSPPDGDLLDAADRGELDDPEGIATIARALLEDARADDALLAFARQWFQTSAVGELARDTELYPTFDAALAASMRDEMDRILLDHLRGPRFLDVYTSRYAYVDPALAELYGVDGASEDASEPTRVELGSEHARAGILGTAGALALTATARGTSPVRRGLYVRQVALCNPPPPPPPEVEAGGEPLEGESPVDAIARHASDPGCRSCHDQLDPIGLGLDRYDAIGALRSTNEAGAPVRLEGYVSGESDPTFAGAAELGELVGASPEASRCVVRQLARWAFAQEPPGSADWGCLLDDLEATFAERDHSFEELLVALVTHPAFRTRPRGEAIVEE
jgi:hypothetical protein